MQRKIGILFCGGCNPLYDRVALAENVRKLGGSAFCMENVKVGEVYDAALVLSGCSTGCVDLKRVNAARIVLVGPEEALSAGFGAQWITARLLEETEEKDL